VKDYGRDGIQCQRLVLSLKWLKKHSLTGEA
jgi:hypothetical protein